MKLNDFIENITQHVSNTVVALWDIDSDEYCSLSFDNFELQLMKSGKCRLSVGRNDYERRVPAENSIQVSELISLLKTILLSRGNIEVVLWDLDTGEYYQLADINIRDWKVINNTKSIAIGLVDYESVLTEKPIQRPISFLMN